MNIWNTHLHSALDQTATDYDKKAAKLRKWKEQLNGQSKANAPTELAKAMLNDHGFCVLHRDSASRLLAMVAIQLADEDFESGDERDGVERLEAALQEELEAANK